MTVRYSRADDAEWERQKEDTPPRYSFTRDQLIDALTRLDARVPVSGPAAGMINAESMAGAIIEALETERRRAFRASLRSGSGG